MELEFRLQVTDQGCSLALNMGGIICNFSIGDRGFQCLIVILFLSSLTFLANFGFTSAKYSFTMHSIVYTLFFRQLRWNWIIGPLGYEAYMCSGECSLTYSSRNKITNHAYIQVNIYRSYSGADPCPKICKNLNYWGDIYPPSPPASAPLRS